MSQPSGPAALTDPTVGPVDRKPPATVQVPAS